ncbi:MAG: cellulase family glycosylhydrolase [Bifidobacteriaceae bacterium]|jgi:hypothetical protein|nr:cellulase family glycosylhydrolase [Bifidobacteriaceae bacterium]
MIDCSAVRGFNYQPSRGTTSLENWYYFDADLWELELRRGKDLFPGFNMVRYWLSWDAYARRPEQFKANFERSLQIADQLGIKVMPCLFNRWHDVSGYDNGGVYTENIALPEAWAYYRTKYADFVADLAADHVADGRIAIWDICNEPYSYTDLNERTWPLVAPETEWLTEAYQILKRHDPDTPVGVSIHQHHERAGMEWITPISDILLVHPYFICTPEQIFDQDHRDDYTARVDRMVAYGKEVGKQLLATETCWGALRDEDRVEILRFTLGVLSERGIGFLAHALHYSLVADLHNPEDGSVGHSYNLAFTTKTGAMRPGHEIFNQF